MFQFTRFPPVSYVLAYRRLRFPQPGFPIQKSADQRSFAPPRSFSQLITSFIGSQCQGIHPTLLFVDHFRHGPATVTGHVASCPHGLSRSFDLVSFSFTYVFQLPDPSGSFRFFLSYTPDFPSEAYPRMSYHCYLRYSICGFQGTSSFLLPILPYR